jgi:hypothetical protein
VKKAPGLLISEFEEWAAVFNPTSWETHLLNADAVEILKLLGAAESSASGGAEFAGPPGNPDNYVEQLLSLGLVSDN